MKKQILAGFVVSGLVSTQALAAFTSTKLLDVTRIAVSDFEAENPDHAAHLTGYKAWKSGQEAKVKIYVDHSGHAMEFNYTCHDHDGELECHAN